ncbi:MAG TPA: M36 family metallopeptidase [Pyrinomonadaceae bacterium]|nr:M36 family metallopeptidase [Pyrinomonadaceae bacterium]
MKNKVRNLRQNGFFKISAAALVWAIIITSLAYLPGKTQADNQNSKLDIYQKKVPNIDVNLLSQATRQPSPLQLSAFAQFQGTYGNQATVRWNKFAGSPDVIMGFHTAPSSETPENTARAFIQNNAALFGVEPSALVLTEQQEGMGGYMLRFQQKFGNLDVAGGGLGFLMTSDKQIRMVMGSTFRDVSASTNSLLNAPAAVARVQQDLAQYAVSLGGNEYLVTPALDAIAAEIAPALRAPRLNIFPTADGYKLSWDVITFSRNPFGVFLSQVDATTGEILNRQNLVRAQDALPYTADIYPSTPGIANYDTGALKLVNGVPEGLTRVNLRKYNPGMNATAVEGVMSGKHALVRNVLATKQPFVQAVQGTFHFRQNNAPIEAQPNEADDLAEPAEHFDTVNMFFFINYLLEYVDDIHKRDDAVHSRIGQGDFPDNYVNSDRPLLGLVHFPNVPGVLGSPIDSKSPDTIVRSLLGLDNAFSVPVVQTIDTPAGPQKVVVNPTLYGHGYLLNDLAKDGPVAYHEGMHSISTPIAGLEGEPEGGALNEAQADLWAYAITGDDSIGAHSIKGARYRQAFRNAGRDPESLAWIRSARSTLKYSQIGTDGNPPVFEEHKDGEIFAATMFELLELMKTSEPQMQFLRPAFGNGEITRQISRGQESWERIFLGSLYLLGLTAPDTFVKARDALIMADRVLYSTDPSDLDAPGQHEALIWQVFAARELGVNAQSPIGGAVTISTAVPEIALSQNRTAAPQGVVLEPATATSIRVSWQPVGGAYAYQVFKRRIGTAGKRQQLSNRPHFDGDKAATGWTHAGYALGGNTSSFEDKGKIEEFFAPAGIKSTESANGYNEMFDNEYAVRAISLNSNRQSGFSDLSGSASFTSSIQDVSGAVSSAISNVSFANGIFEFDNKLTNKGISAADSTAYSPINFKVINISNPTVTTANADNGGDGRNTPGIFNYNQTLFAGQTSAAKRLKFNDPQAQMFTFDTLITARVRGASVPANGSQPYDGDGNGRQEHTITSKTDTYSGIIVLGSAGLNLVSGVDHVDVPFVAQEGAYGVTGVLSSTIPCDLDFYLLDSNGNELATSGNLDSNEEVSAIIQPGKTYIYRVVGFGNGPTPFQIVSTQFSSGTIGNTGSGGSSFGQATTGFTPMKIVRFTVNPLTKTVSVKLL